MTVRELISELQKHDLDKKVYMGYDGNIAMTKAQEVIEAGDNERDSWWPVKPGDIVILNDGD